jgi:hypothetical protein
MKTLVIFILLTAVFAASSANESTLNCRYTGFNGVYSCFVERQSIPDSENRVVITGAHAPTASDSDVRLVILRNDNQIPFIVREFFTKFVNLFRFSKLSSGLTRIAAGDFQNATNLEVLIINFNPLRSITANSFVGASSLLHLDLQSNQIQRIHSDSFNGLPKLQTLMLEENSLANLPTNVFRSLISLEVVYMADNFITALDSRLFINNPKISMLDFYRNRINEVGTSFVDGLTELKFLSLLENRCVNEAWFDGERISTEELREGLDECMKNFKAVKRSNVEIRGKVTISDEYGNELLQS